MSASPGIKPKLQGVPRVLAVEDGDCTAELYQEGLGQEGFDVDIERNGRDGLRRALATRYDVIIVDLTMPVMDGYELIRHLRSHGIETPVLIVSGRSLLAERVAGFEVGADDYLAKPFAFAELVARIRSLLRRDGKRIEREQLKVGDLRLDGVHRRVFRGDSEVSMPAREFRLLEYLMRHAGRVVSRGEILDAVWGYGFDPGTNVVEVHVCRLRERIERDERSRLLKTVRGEGYLLSEEP